MAVLEAIAFVTERRSLGEEEAYTVMNEIISGQATDAQIASLITALRMKGEAESEIAGFARAIRGRAARVRPSRKGLVDTCGTGGDGAKTFNISTAAAFVVAGCGVPVAKHGNRSVSSQCGSADVLEALGVNLNLTPAAAAAAIDETGIGFLFAPVFHAAMKHALRPRREIGIRTVFNLLGPLVNPAAADHQLLGVYAPELTVLLGKVMRRLGVSRALVVHGVGGLDEMSTLGTTVITEVAGDKVKTYRVEPEMFGLSRATAKSLSGGDCCENTAITRRILGGEPGPPGDIVILNAAAALYAAGEVTSIAAGIIPAREAISSGEALRKLEYLVKYTQESGRREAEAERLTPSACKQ